MISNNPDKENIDDSEEFQNNQYQLQGIIGLGKFSSRKSYYPELQKKIKELEEERNKYQRIFSDALSGIFQSDLFGKIIVANQAMVQICGYDSQESFLAIENIGEQLFASSNELKELIEIVSVKQSVLGFETMFTKQDGSEIHVSLNASIQSSGSENFIECFVQDITQKKKTEEEIKAKNEEYLAVNEELRESLEHINEINAELEEAKQKAEESDRLKSAFLANMSHEIRTPMNGIVGFSEMLAGSELSNEKKPYYAKIVIDSSQQLLNIVNDILDISLIETNELKLTMEEVSINDIIKDLYEFYKLKKQNLQFSYKIPLKDDECIVKTDKNRLRQILTNLLNNSFKFTNEGFIEYGYKLKNDELLFFVKDSGIGITKDHLSKIFERFRQEDLDLTRNYGGTGLGLTISKQLVNLLGGDLCVESVKSEGSTFYFTLPYNTGKQSKRKEMLPNENMNDFNETYTILVAEDEDINFLYAKEILERHNLKVIRAKDGNEAVKICLNDSSIDLVLMDIKMPFLNGYEATQKIKEIKPSLPIIALTAYAMDSDKDKAKEAGCDGHVSKPINTKELFSIIEMYKP